AQLLLQMGDAVADDAAIELDLRLADAARADAAGLPLQVRPGARQARQRVLELRQLHLRARLAAAGAAGEDVEDQAAAVDDLRADDLLEVAHLRRPEVVVEHDQRRVVMRGDRLDLLRFPLADERSGVGGGAARQNFPDDLPPRGPDELLELVEVLPGDAAGEPGQEESYAE